MSKKYVSREAPAPGSSVSETHPGYWADRIKYENHRREKWMNHYGQFYYEQPSACYCTEELSYPLDTYQPPMTQIDNYLGAGAVSRSQPFDYLDACIAAKKRHDRCVQKDSGNSKSGCTVYNQMVSARNKNIPRDQCTKAYKQSPDGFGKEHGIPTFIPCVVHAPCGSAQIGIMETRALKGTKCCEMCNMCSKICCQPKVDTSMGKNWAKHPQDSYCFPITSGGCTDHDRMAFRKDTSIQSGGQRRVQKICGPQESSASQCLPCRIKPRSTSVQANISCTPRACCGSSSGGRGQLVNRLCRNPTSETIAPHKDCDATSVPGSSRKPRDPKSVHSSFSRNSVVPRQGYQQLPSGKIFKRRN